MSPPLTLIEGGLADRVVTQPNRFALAVDWIAMQPTSAESPGVKLDPLQEILVRTARMFRDRELARAGR